MGASSAALGRWLANRTGVAVARREEVTLPAPAEVAASPTAAHMLDVDGISPLVTTNEDFYRIDTALSVPMVDLDEWTLSFTGLVDRPFSVTYDELLALPMVERYVTLMCVSNRVGGDLTDNAKCSVSLWQPCSTRRESRPREPR